MSIFFDEFLVKFLNKSIIIVFYQYLQNDVRGNYLIYNMLHYYFLTIYFLCFV